MSSFATESLDVKDLTLILKEHKACWAYSFWFVVLQTPEEEEVLNKKRSKKTQKKYDERKKTAKISTLLEEQFQQGKLLGEST